MTETTERQPDSGLLNSFKEIHTPTISVPGQDGIQRVIDADKTDEDDNRKNEAIEDPLKETETREIEPDKEDVTKEVNEEEKDEDEFESVKEPNDPERSIPPSAPFSSGTQDVKAPDTKEAKGSDKDENIIQERLERGIPKPNPIWMYCTIILLVVCVCQTLFWYQASLELKRYRAMNQQCLSDVDQMTTELQKLKSEKSTCEKIKLDWQTKASELENVSRDLQKDITVLTTTSRNLRQQNENLERLYNEKNITFSELKSKKESLELRLSECVGPIATYGNENVTKLNEDSPIKIAEQFGETYTNEYRNAYEEMEETGMSLGTEKMTKHLLDVLELANILCRKYSREHLNSIKESLTNLSVHVPIDHEREKYFQEEGVSKEETEDKKNLVNVSIHNKLSISDHNQIQDIRKIAAYKMEAPLMKILADIIVTAFNIEPERQPEMMSYIHKCLNLCWMMTMHENPVFIKFIKQSDMTEFDNDMFKPFEHAGKHLSYVLWPPLYLHEGGSLLSKGIAEGMP